MSDWKVFSEEGNSNLLEMRLQKVQPWLFSVLSCSRQGMHRNLEILFSLVSSCLLNGHIGLYLKKKEHLLSNKWVSLQISTLLKKPVGTLLLKLWTDFSCLLPNKKIFKNQISLNLIIQIEKFDWIFF